MARSNGARWVCILSAFGPNHSNKDKDVRNRATMSTGPLSTCYQCIRHSWRCSICTSQTIALPTQMKSAMSNGFESYPVKNEFSIDKYSMNLPLSGLINNACIYTHRPICIYICNCIYIYIYIYAIVSLVRNIFTWIHYFVSEEILSGLWDIQVYENLRCILDTWRESSGMSI